MINITAFCAKRHGNSVASYISLVVGRRDLMRDKTTPYKISRFDFFCNQELAELPLLLMNDEKVLSVISGYYSAGTAILCVTSRRLLLIDKKLIRLNFEDIRFESISEVNYSHQLFVACLNLYYAGRNLQFRTWYKDALRTQAQFIQAKIFESRDTSSKRATDNIEAVAPISNGIIDEPTDNPVAQPAELNRHIGVDTNRFGLESTFKNFVETRSAKWSRARYLTSSINFIAIGQRAVHAALSK